MQTKVMIKLQHSILIVLCLLISSLHGTENNSYTEKELRNLLDKVDRIYRSKTSHSTMTMKIKTPQFERSMTLESWTQGLDYTFMTILSPIKDKGISTLKRNSSMWNYFPKINKVIKIPPSMMLSSWMGSDFTNDDFVKENTYKDDYKAKLLSRTKELISIELIPINDTAAIWGKIIIDLHGIHYYPIKEVFYDERGDKIRTLDFSEIKTQGDRKIPYKMVLTPHHKKDQYTEITYSHLEFDIKLKDSVFTRKNLQKRR